MPQSFALDSIIFNLVINDLEKKLSSEVEKSVNVNKLFGTIYMSNGCEKCKSTS